MVRQELSEALPSAEPTPLDEPIAGPEPLLLRDPTMTVEVRDFLDHGMMQIDGWAIDPFMARMFLHTDAFQKSLAVTGSLFEIGVHHGRTSALLGLMAQPGESVVLIDLFENQEQNLDNSGLGSRHLLGATLERWAPKADYDIRTANSLALDFRDVASLRNGARIIHIDGGHYLDVVLNDLQKSEAVLAKCGVVIVDDFMHSGFPEVNEACHVFFGGQTRLQPVVLGHNKLFLAFEPFADRLRDYFAEVLEEPLGKRVTFHGMPVLCLDAH